MADVRIAGREVPRWLAITSGIGGLVVTYIAVKQYRANKASSASSSAIDPVTGLPVSQDNAIDPLTGQAYLAEAQQYGSVAAAEQAVSAENSSALSSEYGSSGSVGSAGTVGSSTGTVTTEVPSSGYTTNAQWVAAATAGLEQLGYSASDVNAALGAYLASLPETSTQAGITQTAIDEFGPPPVGSFTIIQASTTTTAAAGTTAAGATTTQSIAAVKPIDVAPSGFRVVSVTGGDNVNLAWNDVPGATGYVIAYGPTSGSQQYKQEVGAHTTAATVAGVGGGTAGKHYFELWATPAPANGPHAGPIEATTTKAA